MCQFQDVAWLDIHLQAEAGKAGPGFCRSLGLLISKYVLIAQDTMWQQVYSGGYREGHIHLYQEKQFSLVLHLELFIKLHLIEVFCRIE